MGVCFAATPAIESSLTAFDGATATGEKVKQEMREAQEKQEREEAQRMQQETGDEASPDYGGRTATLVNELYEEGVDRALLLLRHSAREYVDGRHDLDNPLTDAGRHYAERLGAALPKGATVRAYASPPHRCMETAERMLAGHEAGGGAVTRHRPQEALGVFYALDQMKLWQAMREAGGLVPYVEGWIAGTIGPDIMIPAETAARLLLAVLAEKLQNPVADRHLDVCVSHDMTLYLMRTVLLGVPLAAQPVAYLDGLVLFPRAGKLILRSNGADGMTVEAAAP